MATPTPTAAPAAPKTALISKVNTFVMTETGAVEHAISSVHVNGWLLLAAGVGLNLIGVIFHF